MQCDVNVREEAELRRLENGSQVGGDVMLRGDAAEPPVVPAGGAVVSGAVQRSEEISSKLFENGGFRDSANIVKLLCAVQRGNSQTSSRSREAQRLLYPLCRSVCSHLSSKV